MKWIREQMRRLAAFAALMSCGCNLPPIPVTPQPNPAEPQTVKLEISINGEGKINVGGAGKIDVANTSIKTDSPTACDCGCGKESCRCSANQTATTASNAARSGPQFVTQYVRQQVCDQNGGCRLVTLPVQVPVAAQRSFAPRSGGQIVIYDNGSPAGRAMRQAIGSKGVEWKNRQPPVTIGGQFWSPTAVKEDANGNVISSWTPGAGGWHSQSAEQFTQWAAQ